MTLKLFPYSKKHNSTGRPVLSSATALTLDVVFKRSTSLNNPIFLIDRNKAADFFNYNYAVLIDMGMYYFIEDYVIGNNDVIELICKLDVLATARDYIFNSSAFVKYSTFNYDVHIKDERIQPTSEIVTSVNNNSFAAHISTPELTSTYCYVVTTLNEDGVTSYLLNWNGLNYLGAEIMGNAGDIIGTLKQFFNDAKESIIKIQVIPWNKTALEDNHIIGSSSTPVKIGGYTTVVDGYKIDTRCIYLADDAISIPTRPDDFTRCEPYCEAKIHIPLLGVHDLSLAELEDVNTVYFRYISNIMTGATTCILFKGSGDINKAQIIASFDGNVNYEIPMGYISSNNPTGVLTGAAGVGTAIAAAATGGAGAVIAGGIGTAVASFGSYMTKTSSMIGAFGGNASAYDSSKLSIILYKHNLTDDPENLRMLYGRPCGKVVQLSSIKNGYCQTSQYELMAPFDDGVVQEVNRLMDAGVYLYE